MSDLPMRIVGHLDQGGQARRRASTSQPGLIYSTDHNGGLYILEYGD
jgi:hypothetical protein